MVGPGNSFIVIGVLQRLYCWMALIGRESRNQKQKGSDGPGPGGYNLSLSESTHVGYAPFSSCNPRFGKNTNKKELGPGAYEIPTTIGNPSFIKFENERNIIIKINDFGSSAFRSKSNRFQQQMEDTPGVGNYEIEAKKAPKPRKKSVCKSADHPILKIIRENNHQQSMKYQQQHPKVVGNTQSRTPKSLGPGEYNWQQAMKKQNGTSIWSLSKVKRFTEDKKQDLEDSSVVVENIRREKQKENSIKPSSFFKSEAVKSYFDQITYETNSSVKLSIRKQLNYKSQSPAPGTYNVDTPKQYKNTFQFFGSTEERFREDEKDSLGPGEYIIPSGFKVKTIKHVIDQSKRTDFEMNNWMPGPGTYDTQLKAFKQRHHTSIQEFGSLEPRFKSEESKPKESKDSKNATGKNFNLNYNEQKVASSETLPKNRSKSLTQKRNPPTFQAKPTQPLNSQENSFSTPFGIYDLSKNDIGRVAERDKNYLKQLQQSNLKRPPFNSGIERFKASKNVEVSLSLDIPRLYDKMSPSPNNESSAFRSQTKRKIVQKAHGPGVGSYQLQKSVIKDTFNRKYSNKPCGVKAKMSIIKGSGTKPPSNLPQ